MRPEIYTTSSRKFWVEVMQWKTLYYYIPIVIGNFTVMKPVFPCGKIYKGLSRVR